MNCVNCDICVYHLGLCVFFPGVFLSSRVAGACPVTTDLIMRVNVRTTTTTWRWCFEISNLKRLRHIYSHCCFWCVFVHSSRFFPLIMGEVCYISRRALLTTRYLRGECMLRTHPLHKDVYCPRTSFLLDVTFRCVGITPTIVKKK